MSKVSIDPRQSAASASALRTPSRHASMAPSCDPTCRWMPRGRSGADAPAPPPTSMASPISDSVIPNFEPPAPTARPARVSGATSGLTRYRTSIGGAPAPSPRCLGEGRRLVHRFDGHPGQRVAIDGGPDRGAEVGRGLADPLERDRVVRHAAHAERGSIRRARRRSPRTRASATAPITAGTSFALTEYWRTIGSGNAATTDAHAASSAARSVTYAGVPNRRAAACSAPAMTGSRSSSFSRGPRSRDDRADDGDRDAADERRADRVEAEFGREAADREGHAHPGPRSRR